MRHSWSQGPVTDGIPFADSEARLRLGCCTAPHSAEHYSPSNPSMPSLTSQGTIRRAAVESAHHHPNQALAVSPRRRVRDRYAQASVSLGSVGQLP